MTSAAKPRVQSMNASRPVFFGESAAIVSAEKKVD
jgi:hypothetical protein